MKKPRIFIGVREIAGYYSNLKKGFDELEYDSVFVCISHQPLGYFIESNPAWATRVNKLSSLLGRRFVGSWLLRILWTVIFQNLIGILVFGFVLFRYDVFVFGSVSTFFCFLDLPILKLLNKRIIYVFHGSDSRPTYLNGYVLSDTSKKTLKSGVILSFIQKAILTIVDRFADVIVNIPPQSHFHTRPIVSGYFVGIPFRPPSVVSLPAVAPRQAGKIRILHAPSKPGPKGSLLIRETIDRLRDKGLPIDYIEITGRPNIEVLAELSQCDFVVDELYSDTPMAGFAAEAAYFGRPTVVGGYFAADVTRYIPAEHMPPSLFCLPENLEAAIEKMVTDTAYRQELGQRARAFLLEAWSPRQVAERFAALIEDRFPGEWVFDPHDIDYVYGCGLSASKARELIGRYIEFGGTRALWVSDKPKLLAELEKFADPVLLGHVNA